MICTVITEKRYTERTEHGIVFRPDNALVDGHLIVAPLIHLGYATENPVITAQVMRLAAMKANIPSTIVVPIGKIAGQLHSHMYVIIVPSPDISVTMTKRKVR